MKMGEANLTEKAIWAARRERARQRLLWAVGARNPERLAALSATPPERVAEVIGAARARTQVVDKAGWAIAALSV